VIVESALAGDLPAMLAKDSTMAHLSVFMIIDVVLKSSCVAVLAFLLLLGLRTTLKRLNIRVPFVNLGLGRLLLMLIAAWVLVVVCVLFGLNVRAGKDFARTVEAIRSCNCLKIRNTYYSGEAQGNASEELRITDPQVIENLAGTIEDSRCKMRPSDGIAATHDCVEVDIYRDDTSLGWLRIILHNIEIGSPSDFRRYQSPDVYSSETAEYLSDTVRKAIGAKVNE
jgi:hypothetical protein